MGKSFGGTQALDVLRSESEIKVMRLVLAIMEPLYMEFGFFESISRSTFCIVRMSHKCNTVTYSNEALGTTI